MRVLITGGSGLLALNWASCMRHRFDVVLGTHRHRVRLAGTQSVALDLSSVERFARQLRDLAPGLVIHAAGMTSVEQCEHLPAGAEYANTCLAHQVSQATRQQDIRLVHISTDHLFAGDRPLSSENDQPHPLNVYARTKLHAEELVLATDPQALIVRTNFFGWGHASRESFSDWIIGSLRAGRTITMFDDVFFTPILADDLAIAVHELVAQDAVGVYHVVGEERISKYDFAHKTAACFGLPHGLIVRGRIGDSGLRVPRPHDMSLDNAKARGRLGRRIGGADDFLGELFRQERQGRAAELRNAVTES